MTDILVTGSNGFLGKNLITHLKQNDSFVINECNKQTKKEELQNYLKSADIIFHLAGTNRSSIDDEFKENNANFTQEICMMMEQLNVSPRIVYSSTVKFNENSLYGTSKRNAENHLESFAKKNNSGLAIFRLPNLFGKWSKPNYNSVIATFCHNISRKKEITINDGNRMIEFAYVDDVVEDFIAIINKDFNKILFPKVKQTYKSNLNEIVELLKSFSSIGENLEILNFNNGFTKSLYSTYLSYVPSNNYYYDLVKNSDDRGDFVEFIKSKEGGQISYFTSKPGVTRGLHYHHTKTEKFLIIEGEAEFVSKNLDSEEIFKINVNSSEPQVIDTIPGCVHAITNVGKTDLKALVWANEIFDKDKPDTIAEEI